MLVRLFGKNFRSLKDDFELSMVAADLTRKEDRDRGIIEVPIKGMTEPLRLLRCAAIYGANASGKSTVLLAARALQWLGTDSSRLSIPGWRIDSYEPFELSDKSRTSPCVLGCDVVHEGSLLRYEISFNAKQILTESLVLQTEKNPIKLIDRKPSGVVRGKLITSSEANQLYVKEMQPNVSVLSKLAQFGPIKGVESAKPYFDTIQSATQFRDYTHSVNPRGSHAAKHLHRFATDKAYSEWIINHLMKNADVGICDVETSVEKMDSPEQSWEQKQKAGLDTSVQESHVLVSVSFVHEGSSSQKLDFEHESAGTRKLFNIAGDWWRLAHESGTLLADELSASLHPLLLDRLIRAVNDAPSSVKSQLIFTTHDNGLLEGQDGLPPALRRDQVYLIEKNAYGASELYALVEFKDDARSVHNIRKRYLSGLYGAIPLVEMLKL